MQKKKYRALMKVNSHWGTINVNFHWYLRSLIAVTSAGQK